MFPEPGSWAWHFRRVFVAAVEGFRKGAFEKVIPSFASIAQEAEDIANAEFARLGSMPADGAVFDISEWAERANRAGIDYHQTMTDARQAILNVLAIGLHHLFEQQQKYFVRRVPLQEGARQTGFDERLLAYDIDTSTLPCVAKLHELRAVANALKHASLKTNVALAGLRPELFLRPGVPASAREGDIRSMAKSLASRPSTPMAGDQIYVREPDLTAWCDAVVEYWEALAETLNQRYGHRGLG